MIKKSSNHYKKFNPIPLWPRIKKSCALCLGRTWQSLQKEVSGNELCLPSSSRTHPKNAKYIRSVNQMRATRGGSITQPNPINPSQNAMLDATGNFEVAIKKSSKPYKTTEFRSGSGKISGGLCVRRTRQSLERERESKQPSHPSINVPFEPA